MHNLVWPYLNTLNVLLLNFYFIVVIFVYKNLLCVSDFDFVCTFKVHHLSWQTRMYEGIPQCTQMHKVWGTITVQMFGNKSRCYTNSQKTMQLVAWQNSNALKLYTCAP